MANLNCLGRTSRKETGIVVPPIPSRGGTKPFRRALRATDRGVCVRVQNQTMVSGAALLSCPSPIPLPHSFNSTSALRAPFPYCVLRKCIDGTSFFKPPDIHKNRSSCKSKEVISTVFFKLSAIGELKSNHKSEMAAH